MRNTLKQISKESKVETNRVLRAQEKNGRAKTLLAKRKNVKNLERLRTFSGYGNDRFECSPDAGDIIKFVEY